MDETQQKQQRDAAGKGNDVYYYRDSGIHEQHGSVPVWLRLVTASLLIWGVYYLIANWSPPA